MPRVLSALRIRAGISPVHGKAGRDRTGAASAQAEDSVGTDERRGRSLAGVIGRAAAGALVAAAIAATAWRAGSLSRSGTAAAFFVGTIAIATGWTWGALLIVYFTSSSLLSRMGAALKAQ